jgi:hypothetical protein
VVDLLNVEPGLLAGRTGVVILVDKGYATLRSRRSWPSEACSAPGAQGRGAQARPGLLRPLRQRIESVNQTLKGQLDLEQHGGRTIQGVTARVLQRLLALTAAIWHNHHTNQPVVRSLLAYDH